MQRGGAQRRHAALQIRRQQDSHPAAKISCRGRAFPNFIPAIASIRWRRSASWCWLRRTYDRDSSGRPLHDLNLKREPYRGVFMPEPETRRDGRALLEHPESLGWKGWLRLAVKPTGYCSIGNLDRNGPRTSPLGAGPDCRYPPQSRQKRPLGSIAPFTWERQFETMLKGRAGRTSAIAGSAMAHGAPAPVS